MKPALPTAPAAYGLNGPSATVTVNNATTAGLHLSQRKICPNKRGQLCPGGIAAWTSVATANRPLIVGDLCAGGTPQARAWRVAGFRVSGNRDAGNVWRTQFAAIGAEWRDPPCGSCSG